MAFKSLALPTLGQLMETCDQESRFCSNADNFSQKYSQSIKIERNGYAVSYTYRKVVLKLTVALCYAWLIFVTKQILLCSHVFKMFKGHFLCFWNDRTVFTSVHHISSTNQRIPTRFSLEYEEFNNLKVVFFFFNCYIIVWCVASEVKMWLLDDIVY